MYILVKPRTITEITANIYLLTDLRFILKLSCRPRQGFPLFYNIQQNDGVDGPNTFNMFRIEKTFIKCKGNEWKSGDINAPAPTN